MQFSQIPGLEDLKEQLVSTVERNHVPHAMLLSGKHGSPNLAVALAFSTYLNCENPQGGDSCGTCPSCSKASKFIHPDIHYIFPVSSTSSIQAKDAQSKVFLKQWRDFLTKSAYGTIQEWTEAYGGGDKQAFISVVESREIIRDMALKSFEGRYKIVIIWLPELMRAEGANALLKFLEEPPENTLIFMVTNHEDLLLSTITSRTQRIGIRKFTDSEIQKYLENENGIEASRISQISHLADGDIHLAVKLGEEVEDDTHGWVRDWMRLCFTRSFSDLVGLSEAFHAMNKVTRKSVLQYAINMMRESLVAEEASELNRVDGHEQTFVMKFSKVLDIERISEIYQVLNKSIYFLERNASAKMVFLNLSIKISEVLNQNK
jgi:DNA polymerase-3 subunit delta'